MPCHFTQIAFPVPGRTRNGKTPMKFIGKASSFHARYQKLPRGASLLPCGQCLGCRLEKSRQWATRLLYEKDSHHGSIFLTLTYDDNMVPKNGTLIRDHWTTFMKDLRRRLDYHYGQKIKAFGIGEYGDQTGRPHYHAALYGPISTLYPDCEREQAEPSRSGASQFVHSDISAVWRYGLHRFSDLSFESAAYVARYLLKKVTGTSAPSHYGDRLPEFQAPSKGLGKGYYDKWSGDFYPSDHVVLPGRGEFLPPKYFDRLLEKADPVLYEKVKAKRKEAHEKLTTTSLREEVTEQLREGEVLKLVTEKTLIRSL